MRVVGDALGRAGVTSTAMTDVQPSLEDVFLAVVT